MANPSRPKSVPVQKYLGILSKPPIYKVLKQRALAEAAGAGKTQKAPEPPVSTVEVGKIVALDGPPPEKVPPVPPGPSDASAVTDIAFPPAPCAEDSHLQPAEPTTQLPEVQQFPEPGAEEPSQSDGGEPAVIVDVNELRAGMQQDGEDDLATSPLPGPEAPPPLQIPEDMVEGFEHAAAYVEVEVDGETKNFALREGTSTLGRDLASDICLDSGYISVNHAVITIKEGLITIRDKGSTNGMMIDGIKLPTGMDFQVDGSSTIVIGSAEMVRITIRSSGEMKTPVKDKVFFYVSDANSNMLDTIVADNLHLQAGLQSRHEIAHDGQPVAMLEFNEGGQLVFARTKASAPVEIKLNDGPAPESCYLNYGDRLQVGDEIYSAFPSTDNRRESISPSQTLFLKYNALQDADASFFHELQVMEKAIRAIPEPFAESALKIWGKMMDEELEKVNDSKDIFSCESQKVMVAMDYLVGRAVCYALKKCDEGGEPLAYFNLLGKNQRRKHFALIAKKFGRRDVRRLKHHRIKLDRKLKKALRKARKADNPPGKILAFLDNLPEETLEMYDAGELRADLFSGMYSERRNEAIVKLNSVLNDQGVMVWEHEGEVVLARVHGVIEGNEGRSLVIGPQKGFSYILGIDYAGMYNQRHGLTVVSRDTAWLGGKTETHEHELQHLLDGVSGYMDEADKADDRNALVEATAIAAEYMHSRTNEHSILLTLWSRRVSSSKYVAISGKFDRYSRASNILLARIRKREKGTSVNDALKQYIEEVYEDKLGISFTDLYNGEDKSPAEIVSEHYKVDSLVSSITSNERTMMVGEGLFKKMQQGKRTSLF